MHNKQSGALGEFDGISVSNKVIIEDKSALGIDTKNPITGKIEQTPESWAAKQIYSKTAKRISNLDKAEWLTPTSGMGNEVPSLGDLKEIRSIHFKINSSDERVLKAVNKYIKELKHDFPDWNFSVTFGNRPAK